MARGYGISTVLALGMAAAGLAVLPSSAPVAGPASAPVEDGSADRQRLNENEMLARARAEQAAWSSEGDRTREAEAEALKRRRQAEREAELDQVSARLRSSPRQRIAIMPGPFAEPAPAQAYAELTAATPRVERATVLLALEPGHTGIRRFNPTADPVLCLGVICYVSQGADADALALPRRRVLGALNTISNRAGACNERMSCIFRNIEIDSAANLVQPVDLRLIRHDRREARPARVDHTCRVEQGRLSCAGAQTGTDYRLWIVPEAVARQAGPRQLTMAVTILEPPNPPR